ncbi:MAG: hypothetical protein IJT83_14585 [Victivallales bacterium]|nr:hypothetical protein [Victivallales bacterium]
MKSSGSTGHKVAATARKSGGSTHRPESHESIMDALGKLDSMDTTDGKLDTALELFVNG